MEDTKSVIKAPFSDSACPLPRLTFPPNGKEKLQVVYSHGVKGEFSPRFYKRHSQVFVNDNLPRNNSSILKGKLELLQKGKIQLSSSSDFFVKRLVRSRFRRSGLVRPLEGLVRFGKVW